MGQMLRWSAPNTDFDYTHTKIYRSTDSGSSYSEVSDSDVVGYTSDGLPIAQTYAFDKNGDEGYYYKIQFYDNVNVTSSDFSEVIIADDTRGYCTVEDVRSFSNVQTNEFDDGAVQLIIDSITAEIDHKTGRTWLGTTTVTDEYYDTDGGQDLYLKHGDIQSVTALSVDKDVSNSYTTVTASKVLVYSGEGRIRLDTRNSDIEVTSFPDDGPKAAKVSYTYGNTQPSSEVKYLAILMVLNQIHVDPVRYNKAQSILNRLTRKSFNTSRS